MLTDLSSNHFVGGWKKDNGHQNAKSVFELEIKTHENQVIDMKVSSTPLKINNKMLILGVVRQIQERKQNEKLLRDIAVARQSVKFKQNFLANMSHEIRTPMAGVLGMVEMLSTTRLDRNQLDYVNTLKISTEHLMEIINQILDYSKIEAGKIKLRTKIFTVKSVVENSQKFFNGICQKDIVFEATIDSQLPPTIQSDEQRIKQIVSNLLSNAVKFTHEAKITMHATLEKWIDDKNLPPVVGLSANAFEGDKEKYMALGRDEYLTKPVKKDDFMGLLARLNPLQPGS